MASISDRLKSLGVSIGGNKLSARIKRQDFPIQNVIDGQTEETPFGEAFFVEEIFPEKHEHGNRVVQFPPAIDRLAVWARDAKLADMDPGAFLFLDTETTGLSGGSGTYAFLVGVGRFQDDQFVQRQFFLRDPAEEAAMLSAIENFAAPADALVTFNGKSFDIPLMSTRFLSNSAPSPFTGMGHIDLLHLARRLWRDVLPSRALGDLELEILGINRSSQDIPGWMIPEMYTDYLRSGDARPLAGVFYHNAMDILSMVTLLDLMARKLETPLGDSGQHHAELYAIGRLFADLGFPDEAIDVFQNTLDRDLSGRIKSQLVENLAWLHRRKGDFDSALKLWESAAKDGEVYAHVEIAKYYEHQTGDFSEALVYSQTAMKIVRSSATKRFDRLHWRPLIEHRLNRLEGKIIRRTKKKKTKRD